MNGGEVHSDLQIPNNNSKTLPFLCLANYITFTVGKVYYNPSMESAHDVLHNPQLSRMTCTLFLYHVFDSSSEKVLIEYMTGMVLGFRVHR